MHRSAALAVVSLSIAFLSSSARAALPEHPSIEQGPPAAWIDAGDEEIPPAPEDASGLGFRLRDDQVRIAGDESAVHARVVVDVLSQQGLDTAARWEVDFDPRYQRVRVHELSVERDGVRSDRLASVRASVLQREAELGRQIVDETLTLLLVLDDVRVGDTVRFSNTVEGYPPVLGGRYANAFRLGYGLPLAERRVRVLAPVDQTLIHRLHGGAPPPEERVAAGWRELRWHQRDLGAVELDPNAPADWIALPVAQISQFASWAEVAAWGQPLYEPQPLPPELLAIRDEIAAASDDSGERLVAAARWVQDEIRYFGVMLGVHSHQPHPIDEVLRRRYGDCKDKTLLLITLLEALGIEAWPALVDSAGGKVESLHPSPFAFDHVVVVAQLGEREVWIDATAALQGGDAESLYFPFVDGALELRPGVEALSEVPEAQADPGSIEVRHEYLIEEEGEPFEATIRTLYTGGRAEAQRRYLAGTRLDELQRSYVGFYTEGTRTVEPLAELEVEDDRAANRLTIVERYRVVDCWQPADDGNRCDLLPLTLANDLVWPSRLDREAPLALPRRLHAKETISLRAPESWTLEPIEAQETNPWFAYRVSSRTDGNHIEIDYQLETLADRVEPADLGRYVLGMQVIDDTLGYSIHTPDEPSQEVYFWIGLAVVGTAVLLLAAVAALIAWIVMRSDKRRVAPVVQPPPLPASARQPPPLPPSAPQPPSLPASARRAGLHPGLIAMIALIPLGVIFFVGLIAALTIPNFIDALDKARHKRTLADLSTLHEALDDYRRSAGHYPAAESVADLVAVLPDPPGERPLATEDAWGQALVYRCTRPNGDDGCADYRLVSAGSDQTLELTDPALYEPEDLDPDSRHRDLVLGAEGWIRAPEGAKRL